MPKILIAIIALISIGCATTDMSNYVHVSQYNKLLNEKQNQQAIYEEAATIITDDIACVANVILYLNEVSATYKVAYKSTLQALKTANPKYLVYIPDNHFPMVADKYPCFKTFLSNWSGQ